jgi:TonB family protein
MRGRSVAVAVSIAAHVAAAAGIAAIPRDVARRSTLVAVVEKKKDDKKKADEKQAKAEDPTPPPPIPAPRAAPKPKPASQNTPPPPPAAAPPAAAPAAAAHPTLAALPDLGISMAGGPGGVGIAVPARASDAPDAPKAVEGVRPAPKPKDDCAEDAVKPKLAGAIAQDRIIAAAQAAGGVEGKIRLELLVDETGAVTSVRVMAGLGGAIDEAAVSAARRVKVNPSTRCGRAVAGRLVVAITVRNPD